MMYPESLIEEIRTRNDIVDVISQYVKLTRKGSNYFGLCPFHNEKTGSFSVSAVKQMYYCFGCGAGGNVITFIMEYENYTFKEALKYLADRAGIELAEQEESEEARKEADLRTRLLEVNKVAAKYFYYQLKSERGARAYQYFKDRGLSDETIVRFGLGFSNPFQDDLYRYLKGKGYTDELLSQSGLVRIEERGAYDKFWNRAMFPIMDVNNRVIGFGGRVMGEGEPKYLNSPETKVFDKSRNLYGLNIARHTKLPYLLVCEGYMDVISMHQAGFTNAVASLGTAFTLQHANLIKRYTHQVILTYDSDGAGQKAALRAIPILKDAGLSVKVLNMKPYKDPDEFIKSLGAEEFQKRIDTALGSFLFEIDVLKSGYDMKDPEQKTAFYNETAKKLLEFTEELERNNYIEAISGRYQIDYESLRRLVNTQALKSGYDGAQKQQVKEWQDQRVRKEKKEDGIRMSQKLLLTWLIEDPKLYPKIKDILTPEDFTEDLYQRVAAKVFEQLERGEVNPAGILNYFINDENEYKEATSLFHARLKESIPTKEEREKALTETVIRVKKNRLDMDSRTATDIALLQEIMKKQAGLKSLHISLD